MPDITMCKGTGCPKLMTCYRFLAEPWERQSWFAAPPYNKETDTCRHYAQATEEEKRAYDKRTAKKSQGR